MIYALCWFKSGMPLTACLSVSVELHGEERITLLCQWRLVKT